MHEEFAEICEICGHHLATPGAKPPNENKISDSGRERALIGGEVWKSWERFARYLFFAAIIAFIVAFVLLYFYSPPEVQIVSDVFHPEYGSRRITPLTIAERSASWVGLFGFVASMSSVIALLVSFYRASPDATPTI